MPPPDSRGEGGEGRHVARRRGPQGVPTSSEFSPFCNLVSYLPACLSAGVLRAVTCHKRSAERRREGKKEIYPGENAMEILDNIFVQYFSPGSPNNFLAPKQAKKISIFFSPSVSRRISRKLYVHQLCHTSSKFPAFLSHCPNFTSFFPQMVFLCVSARGMIRKTMDIVALFFQESTPKLPIIFLFSCASDPEFGRLDSQRQCSYLAVEYFFCEFMGKLDCTYFGVFKRSMEIKWLIRQVS